MSSGQRVVVYTNAATGKTEVYATWYTQEEMRRAIISCGRAHGRASNPRSRVG